MTIRTTNPATGEPLAEYPIMARSEVMDITRRAHEAFLSWRDLTPRQRVPYFLELAAVLRGNLDEWARLITLEMGKTIVESRAEIEKCAWMTEVYAQRAPDWLADEDVEADGLRHVITMQPLGVVFSIMPWNYPFWQALRFAVPGMLAGNASLLKHASNVTGCGLAIEAAFRRAGFPDDLFRTVVPDHETVSELIGDDRIRGVSLTGSTQVGAHIGALAGRQIKPAVLELGGSDPFIVLEDADIDFAARGAAAGRMVAAGQSCIASKRFIVVEPLAEAFAARLAELMGALKSGDPLDPETRVGAIASEAALRELAGQCDDALARGACALVGGRPGPGPGFFFQPTVLVGVTPEMRVMREEVFGPIAPVFAVRDEDQAVSMANASEFGLGGSVWTADPARGERVARRVESGTLFVNSFTKSDPRMPFGGVKRSGIGRELSRYGLMAFVNIKGINVYEHGSG